jgi:hypothetical protein
VEPACDVKLCETNNTALVCGALLACLSLPSPLTACHLVSVTVAYLAVLTSVDACCRTLLAAFTLLNVPFAPSRPAVAFEIHSSEMDKLNLQL